MRVFCFAFIVYLVLLLAQPCQDLAATVTDCADADMETAHIDKNSDSDPESDECSPFCICSCCSHPVSNHKLSLALTSEVKQIAPSTLLVAYTNPYTDAHHNSIWQPPKA